MNIIILLVLAAVFCWAYAFTRQIDSIVARTEAEHQEYDEEFARYRADIAEIQSHRREVMAIRRQAVLKQIADILCERQGLSYIAYEDILNAMSQQEKEQLDTVAAESANVILMQKENARGREFIATQDQILARLSALNEEFPLLVKIIQKVFDKIGAS